MRKKTILSIITILFTSAMVFAQNLSFIDNDGNTIPDNSTIVFNNIHDYHLSADVYVKNNSDQNIGGDFQLSVINKDGDVDGVQCCGFGTCVQVDSYFEEVFGIDPGKTLDPDVYLLIFGEEPPKAIFSIKTEFKVINAEEEHSINVILTNAPTGVGNVSAQKNVFITQNGNGVSLNFNFEKNAQRALNIYDITGRKIKEMALNGNSGIIRLPDSPKGIYLYSVSEKEIIITTGKFLVK